MSFTDREYLKMQQAGALGTSGATNATGEVSNAHTRSRDYTKVGTENAATNVAETLCFVVNRKSKLVSAKYLTGTAVAANATDYVFVTLSKRAANGASQTTVATYNTHPSAQGAISANAGAAFSIVTSSDAVIAAGSPLSYTIDKYGAGKAVAIGTFTFDLEEV